MWDCAFVVCIRPSLRIRPPPSAACRSVRLVKYILIIHADIFDDRVALIARTRFASFGVNVIT